MNATEAKNLLRRLQTQGRLPDEWDVKVAEVCADYLHSDYGREKLREIYVRRALLVGAMPKAEVKPTGTEAIVCQDIARRQALEVAKYGKTVSENPLPLREWIQHAYEECLDLAVYLRRAMEEIR